MSEVRSEDLSDSSRLKRVSRVIGRIEDGLLILMLSTIILLATTQIVLRNLFDSGLVWGDPLAKVLVLWVALLGAMAATRDDNHINIDLLSRFFPDRLKAMIRFITYLFAALVCTVVAYHAARLVIIDHEAGTLAFATVPTWACELIIPAGFALMGLRFLFASITGIYRTFRPPA